MAISEFPTPIKDSLSQFGDVALNSRSPVNLRGSNFKKPSYIYSDSTKQKQWLWKRSNDTSIIREYIASYLAVKLGINVPRALLAKKGTQIGLLYEWLDESVELREIKTSQLKKCPSKDVVQLLLLEAWIGASDRHSGNYLMVKNNLWAIDLERSFDTDPLDSELSLYFDWLKESQSMIKEKVEEFKKQIEDQNILQDDFRIIEMIENLPIDSRAKVALKIQVKKMFTCLNSNFQVMSSRIDNYFLNSNNISFV
ncbi:MAG: hypothetical protein ACXABU_11000 [Candidatus Hodarchaeales archaeon]|jgi:hypothetical protein